MPWTITKIKGGYRVKSKVSGRVAIIKGKNAKKRLRGYMWHSEHGK
jgi:hypothetical protein